jgi:hypothetical protein
MKGIELRLANGHYRVRRGENFEIDGGEVPFLCYTENDIWHVESDPERESGSDALITIPYDDAVENVSIRLKNAALYSCSLNAGTVNLDIRDSQVNMNSIFARRIIIAMGKGEANIRLAPSVAADIDCGSGKMMLRLAENERGYRIESECGAGSIELGGRKVGRVNKSGNENGVMIKLRCGLGNVIITESSEKKR